MRLATHRLTSERKSDRPEIVALHGFTQTGMSWMPVATALGDGWCLTALDLPGHGDSPEGNRSLDETADDVAGTIDGLRPILVGYSMGARVALHVALRHAGAISGLVLVSGTAGIDDDTEREARLRADQTLARHIEEIGVEAFVSEWLAQPMFATLPGDAARIAERLTNSASGLADSLRYAGTGTQMPLWGRLAEIDVPTLVVTGDLDAKFTALGDRIAGAIPAARRVRIPDAGHTVHLERTDAFATALTTWLAGIADR